MRDILLNWNPDSQERLDFTKLFASGQKVFPTTEPHLERVPRGPGRLSNDAAPASSWAVSELVN